MLKGIQLQLLVGPSMPRPVSREAIEALSAVEVKVQPEQTSFQLTFEISKRATFPNQFLPQDGPPRQLRVILVAIINSTPEVLVDGIVTHQELNPGDAGGTTTLTVTGEDLSVLMSTEERTGMPYPSMTPDARVGKILGRYAQYGIVPEVKRPSLTEVHAPADRTPQHHGHDLDYIRLLAKQVGHVFYIKPTSSPGTTIAYWGPQIRNGQPQPTLNVDMDIHTNTDQLSFTFDHTQREDPQLRVQDADSKQAQQLPPPDPSQVDTPLGRAQPKPFRRVIVSHAANKTPTEATLLGLGAAARSSDAVTGTGKISVSRYGRLLRARELVAVRGAGMAFDGLWWVESVTHAIKRNEYGQDFILKRNALNSTVQRVAP
jgi:hypothetical protein